MDNLKNSLSFEDLVSLMKVLTVASYEHLQGQSILAKEIAAFGYYTILYLRRPILTAEQFIALVRRFNLPQVNNFESFCEEFNYLVGNLDLRYFMYKQDSQTHKLLNSLRNESEHLGIESVGVSHAQIARDIDLTQSTFGFDLFRRVSIERNW
jgi:hypothetical protein